MVTPADLHAAVRSSMASVLVGHDDVVEGMTIALLTQGHVLLEGVPGVAKTTMANLFARSMGLEVNRIQMTPDILPADITGTYVFREATGEFQLRHGPIFANIVIADEINRATPKTQSALLEAMEEMQVSIEGNSIQLETPFMVVATQNPVEKAGTFELPVAQRDRFQQKLWVPIPDRDVEHDMLVRFDDDPALGPMDVESALSPGDVTSARAAVEEIHVAEAVREYILDIVEATRAHPDTEHGASPRATLAVLAASRARAAIHGRAYVIPDDVKALLDQTLTHRLVLDTEASLSGVAAADVIEEIAENVAPPGSEVADNVEMAEGN